MPSLNGFNAHEVDPSTPFEPIPAGSYTAAIVESETRPTKAGRGSYLQLAFEVLDGPHKGRMLWSRLNLENANETTVRIARGELSSICRAVNVMTPRDSAELHGIPLTVVVGLRKRQDNGEMGNVIRGYAKREAGGSAGAAARTPAGGTPPWKRTAAGAC